MDKRWTRASFASPEHPSDTRIPRRASGAGGSGPPLVLAVHAWPARDAAAVPGEPKRPVAGSRRSPPFARSGAPFVLRHRRHRVPAAGHGAQRRRDPSGLIFARASRPLPVGTPRERPGAVTPTASRGTGASKKRAGAGSAPKARPTRPARAAAGRERGSSGSGRHRRTTPLALELLPGGRIRYACRIAGCPPPTPPRRQRGRR